MPKQPEREEVSDRKLLARLNTVERNIGISEQIKALRRIRGISQMQLAKKLGTKQPNISKLETTGEGLDMDFLSKVSEVLEARLVIAFEPNELAAAHFTAEIKARAQIKAKPYRVFPDEESEKAANRDEEELA